MTPAHNAIEHAEKRVPSEKTLIAWDAAADAWIEAVQEGRTHHQELRRRAIVGVVREVPPGPILDAGCGDGWLVRELASHGHHVSAFDGSAAQVARTRAGGGGSAVFQLAYEDAALNPRRLKGPYGTVVFNDALFEERVTRILGAVQAVLFPYGRILVQTVHPAAAGGEYKDGWRTEPLAGLAPEGPPVPWYFRTLGGWIRELRWAGLVLTDVYEPLDPETGKPMTLILGAAAPERRKG
jgi:2-polyprenyl-3-methyl-5-hydroxy-6-metoxy-1,4-benzoquinol methylase